MLQKLRNPYVMRWGLWVILGLTIPSFVLFYGFGKGDHQGAFEGTLITLETDQGEVELDRQYLGWVKQEATGYYLQLAAMTFGLQPEQYGMVRGMIDNSLSSMEVADFAMGQVALSQRLERQGVRVTDNQVSIYLTNQGYTQEILQATLQQRRQTEYKFLRDIRREITSTMAEQTVGRMARTSLLELWNEYLLSNEKLSGEMTRFTMPSESDVVVSDEDLQAGYDKLVADKNAFVIDRAKRVYDYVKVASPRVETVTPTDDELRTAYDALTPEDDPDYFKEAGFKVRHVLVSTSPKDSAETIGKARVRAEAARERLLDGEDFTLVANETSEDWRNLSFPDAASSATLNGGVIPYFFTGSEADAFGAEWAEFARTAEPGLLSPVIETPQGFSVLEVMERRPEGKLSFEDAKTQLTERIRTEAREAAETQKKETMEKNLARAREAVASQTTMEGLARALDTSVETTSPTLVNAMFFPGIGDVSGEREAIARLEPSRIGPVMQNRAGDIIVLRIREEIPERVYTLEEIRDRLLARLQREREVEKARGTATKIKEMVASGDSFTSAVLTLDADSLVTPVADLARNAGDQAPPEFRGIQDLELALITARKGDVLILNSGMGDSVNSVIVFHVTGIKSPTIPEFMDAVRDEQLELRYLAGKRQGYLEEFRRDARNSLNARFSEFFKPEEDEAPRKRPQKGG